MMVRSKWLLMERNAIAVIITAGSQCLHLRQASRAHFGTATWCTVQQRLLLCTSFRTSKEQRALTIRSAGGVDCEQAGAQQKTLQPLTSHTIPLEIGQAVSVSANILVCCASMLCSHKAQ